MLARSLRPSLAGLAIVAAVGTGAIARPAGAQVHVEAQPAPPYPPRPRTAPVPPPPVYYYPPPPPRVIDPPPLSPVMRALYAPFYAAGLVLRYGLYYGIVAPLEVFGRALEYGVQGGVEQPRSREARS